jgi:acetyltransferase-like isoleucine patch superfamily enzyme
MRKVAEDFLNHWAKARISKRSNLSVAPTARVNYRGTVHRPPSLLTIGEGTIFEGRISSEREGTVVTIGRNTFVGGSHIVCAEKITIGDDVLISWGCTIVDHNSHALSWVDRADDVKEYYYGRKNWNKVKISPVTICDRVWIGFNSIVLCGVTVGEGAVVGCGSIVTKDVLPYSVVAGCPARIIREAGDVV